MQPGFKAGSNRQRLCTNAFEGSRYRQLIDLPAGAGRFSPVRRLDGAYVPFFCMFGAARDDTMVARWSAIRWRCYGRRWMQRSSARGRWGTPTTPRRGTCRCAPGPSPLKVNHPLPRPARRGPAIPSECPRPDVAEEHRDGAGPGRVVGGRAAAPPATGRCRPANRARCRSTAASELAAVAHWRQLELQRLPVGVEDQVDEEPFLAEARP